ncbi:hypothetical protein H4R19_003266 [Coemansia spiralis]|nr:hypothetical protein H4R19_003266 [Coemansia spiralis]
MEMQPPTNIQIAVKSSVGVFYFQTQYSLHILFEESGKCDQAQFLRMWKALPDSGHGAHTIRGVRFASMDEMRDKLNMNNVFTVAQRSVGGATHFYTTSKLCDGSMFFSEIKVADNLQLAVVTTKSSNAPAVGLYQVAISDICTAA